MTCLLNPKALLVMALLQASAASSQNAPAADQSGLSESFSAVQSIGGPGSRITITECTFAVELHPQTPCQFDSTSNVRRTIIDLTEVDEIELRPFKEVMSLKFHLEVSSPNFFLTWADRLSLGRDKSFDNYVERSGALLDQTELTSKTEIEMCDGTVQTSKERQQMVFLDETPSFWSEFEGLLETCQAE